jgi:ribosomal protein S12 methylthiotransferase accessory factor YcaO
MRLPTDDAGKFELVKGIIEILEKEGFKITCVNGSFAVSYPSLENVTFIYHYFDTAGELFAFGCGISAAKKIEKKG